MGIFEKLAPRSFRFFHLQDLRSKQIRSNIFYLGVLQLINLATSFLLVPLTIDYLTDEYYGIWLTMSSIIAWFSLLDLGLGNGLRNKLTDSLAKNEILLAKQYVSTAYFSLGGLLLMFMVISFVVNKYINWSNVLNQDTSMNEVLRATSLIVFVFFFLKLLFQLIAVILTAKLIPAGAALLSTISSVLSLLIIWILTKTTEGHLPLLALIMSGVPVIIYSVASIFLFGTSFKIISPSIKYFKASAVKSLLVLGVGFFLINISTVVLFQTNNLIIIRLFSSQEVVKYNIAYKLFSVITILFTLIVQPYWSAFTDAWAKNEIEWVKNSIKRLYYVWYGFVILGVFILIASPMIYKVWIGGRIEVPFTLSLVMLLYFYSHTYGGIYNMFINGIGRIRMQIICLTISMVIYIPVVLLFVNKFKLGLTSIPLALIISNFYSLFIARIQYKKLITGIATGIWDK